VDLEDVMRLDHGGKTYALYRDAKGSYFATDGVCTHEHAQLADGLVFGHLIECPKHNGRFDIRTGRAVRAPACVDLASYPVRVEGGAVLIGLPPVGTES
jgi:3-phenylpropionate/trans-cinnamate dioxygenase ferredoxin subunit